MLTGSTPGGGELSIHVTHTDMGLCFRAHLNTWRESLSVDCISPWELVWASPGIWETPRLKKKKKWLTSYFHKKGSYSNLVKKKEKSSYSNG